MTFYYKFPCLWYWKGKKVLVWALTMSSNGTSDYSSRCHCGLPSYSHSIFSCLLWCHNCYRQGSNIFVMMVPNHSCLGVTNFSSLLSNMRTDTFRYLCFDLSKPHEVWRQHGCDQLCQYTRGQACPCNVRDGHRLLGARLWLNAYDLSATERNSRFPQYSSRAWVHK